MKDSSKNFTIRLTMLSDWHVGTGAGWPGNVDKLIARDADGFPFVPAKTLNGIWRDAMETLTLGLDGGGKQNDGQPKYEWQRFVESIFGNQPALPGAEPTIKPFSSILSVQPARLNQALRDRISSFRETDKQKYLTALTFIKPGVEIDEESGTARQDFLRFEEMGRSGTVLTADCKLHFGNLENVTDQQKNTIWALLVSSARLVERIGGKRRRGAGRCVWELLDEEGGEVPVAAAIQELQLFKGKDTPKAPAFRSLTNEFDLNRLASTGEWQHLEFSLTLKTPVSIVTATLGNVSESLDFIPGTYLLPHFTRVLGKHLGKQFFQAVAYGDFQVSPATIEIDDERGLPMPMVLAKAKVKNRQGEQPIYNRLVQSIEGEPQTKPLRSGFLKSLEQNKIVINEEDFKTLLMHNAVEDKYQRPTTDVVGVFSREAIAAGTVLRGELRTKNPQIQTLLEELSETKSQSVRLGTSRKDDYGLAELKVFKTETRKAEGDTENQVSELALEKLLTVYCESDVLLTNENLRQTNLAQDLAQVLSEQLGVTLSKAKAEKGKIGSLIQTRRIESWHEGWGFPRPTLIAMAAGSCIVFKIEEFDSLDEAKKAEIEKALQMLEAKGIGERRGEGYGQIRFNPPILTQPINRWSVADKANDKPKTNDEATAALDVDDFVRQIEEVVWREELKVAVLKSASDPHKRKGIFGFEIHGKHADKRGVPPMSQIGGLRSVVSRLKDNGEHSKKVITEWLAHLEATANRITKWDKDGIPDKAKVKTKAIKTLIEKSDEVWERLADEFREPPVLAGEAKDLKEGLWAEAVRSLFDACARAHKRELEKVEKRKERQNGATN